MMAVTSLNTTVFDAVYETLPPNLKDCVDVLFTESKGETRHTFDRLLRFSLGRNHPEGDAISPAEWTEAQSRLELVLSNLKEGSSEGKKRGRDDDPSEHAAKRTKVDVTLPSGDKDDSPLFTLHAFSVTAPIRKKVDVAVHQHSIRFTNSTSGVLESVVPIETLTRAFLLSTPGKTKPHWTIILLSSSEQNQIIFGTDDVLSSLKTTDHPNPPQISPKGTSVEVALRNFLSNLPSRIPFLEPSTSKFRSGSGEPWLDTYLRAKEGHLFFFSSGVLFGLKKPCIWIGMEDIESIRSLSATGRTFSVFIKRQPTNKDEGEEGEETEFSMIDGKHQDSVSQWVRHNQHLFGTIPDKGRERDSTEKEQETELQNSKADSDSSDDSDYHSESESDGGSATSSSEEDGNSEGEQDEEDGEGEVDEDEDEEDDVTEDLDEKLNPSRHPLMKPGAVPRLSKAAMDAVIGMVERDLKGGTQSILNGHEIDELGDDEDDEIDQLE